MTRLLCILATLALGSFAGAGIVDLSTSKFAAHYGYLRQVASSPSADARYGEAASILMKLQESFPNEIALRSGITQKASDVGQERINELYWRSIDVLAYSSRDVGVLASIPARFPRPIGGKLDTKSVVDKVIAALNSSSKAWDEDWKKHERDVKSQIQVWTSVYGGHVDPDLRKISEKFGMSKMPDKVDIVVLPFTGGKEGMTLQTLEGWRVVIGAKSFDSSAFAEVVLHESVHVLDVLNRDSGYLALIRKELIAAKRPPLEIEQIPHVSIFLAAAERIRAREPKHKPVGELGAFDRLPKKLVDAARAGFVKLPDQEAAVREVLARLG
jgi:hypothetical protein